MITWQQWLIKAAIRLSKSLIPSAKCDVEIFLMKVTGATRSQLLAFGETLITNTQDIILETFIIRREHGEPVAYIIGEREFWSLRLQVSLDTLIPRPDTECLVEQALKVSPSYRINKVLDLGTGNGAIALAIASERPLWKIIGIDCSSGAIEIARNNATYLGLKNVDFYQSNWFKSLKIQRYNLIISNPPYIGEEDYHLKHGDVRFEPRIALISGKDGLKDLRIICREAKSYLMPGGWLLLEHGCSQGTSVRSFLIQEGFNHVSTIKDYSNNERVSQGQKIN